MVPRIGPWSGTTLSACRAFDQHLLGISPDYEVRLAPRRLLDDDDGPMLEVLKQFGGGTIELPARTSLRPDRERLAARFTLFANAV
jgi:putative restriction endonuclease